MNRRSVVKDSDKDDHLSRDLVTGAHCGIDKMAAGRLKDKVVVVTASTDGIGTATQLALERARAQCVSQVMPLPSDCAVRARAW